MKVKMRQLVNENLAIQIEKQFGKPAKEVLKDVYGDDYKKPIDLTWEELLIGCSSTQRGPGLIERDE